MQAATLNSEESTKSYARFAVLDERRKSADAKSFYTSDQLTSALRAFDLLDFVYSSDEKYINYRKKFIAIKLSNPIVINEGMLTSVEELFAEQGYTKVETKQGIIYRLPRVVI